ncbi:hypothetical protein H6F93_10280 [Leptolyngbya sp. FACHB-671]|uniref:hypothetical protein n=1 Tax=Leptolyngbya sp. FACHB-671 TaxID=2692812 RepID=UPI001683E880|nr:hypothetical protein [Leptolyngbya sp. FACHB-671]MBD1868739.1 hypothetical protein [Cyanobacteria bacterium FACHB-471]MBD2067905.1 hypothetical protein [Leptolyngbya sp. FACHB-671]
MQLNYRHQPTSDNVAIPDRISTSDLHSKLISTHYTPSRRPNLTAQWIVEDGKLVCKWIVN